MDQEQPEVAHLCPPGVWPPQVKRLAYWIPSEWLSAEPESTEDASACMQPQSVSAEIQMLPDGSRVVLVADPIIRIDAAILARLRPDVIEPDGVLRLDSAGEYRYRFVRTEGQRWLIYARIYEAQVSTPD